MANKSNSLAHTKWMCKYHIVFTPKYRRKIIYNQYKESIRDILKQLCSYKGVEILEGHLMPDHIHMLVSIPPKYSISSFMGYLKGKSALMIFDKHANLKYKFGNRHLLRQVPPEHCCGRNRLLSAQVFSSQIHWKRGMNILVPVSLSIFLLSCRLCRLVRIIKIVRKFSKAAEILIWCYLIIIRC